MACFFVLYECVARRPRGCQEVSGPAFQQGFLGYCRGLIWSHILQDATSNTAQDDGNDLGRLFYGLCVAFRVQSRSAELVPGLVLCIRHRIRGPKDHISIRISCSGLTAQYKGDTRNHAL